MIKIVKNKGRRKAFGFSAEELNELGIETAPILRTEIEKTNLPKTEKTEYETVKWK